MKNLKKYWLIILFGLILRILIAGFTYHSDVRNNSIATTIILREHDLNPYDFSSTLNNNDNRKKIYSNEIMDDLPIVYWINIPIEFVLRPLVNLNIEDQYLTKIDNSFGNPALFLYLLIIKMPFIFFDILLGILLTYLVSESYRKKILYLWLFNPMTLWASSAIGQFDIIPTFFMVLSYFLLQKKSLGWSAFSLGVAAAMKSFGFLIFPFLILTVDSWKERIKLTAIFIIPWFFSVMPYLPSAGFRHNALFAPQLNKILYSQIPLSGGEAILVVPAILLSLYLIFLTKKRTMDDFIKFSLSALLLVLAFTHFHIQWFLWVTPLILIISENLKTSIKLSIYFLGLSVVPMLFLFEPSLQMRLFAPIFPPLNEARGLVEILGLDRSNILRNIAVTLFAASSVFISAFLISGKKLTNER